MDSGTQPLFGPIQLVVMGFPPDADFHGQIQQALHDLRGRGVIRIIDSLFVRKDADGRINANIRQSDISFKDRQRMGAVVGGLLGLALGGDEESEALGATQAAHAIADDAFGFGVGNLQDVKDKIPPGAAALLLLIEHQWGLDLKAAVRSAGGVPITQGFLTPEALFMVGSEVRAVVDAEDAIAAARALEGAAILAALATVEAADMVQQAAIAETARVLIAAGLIEEAAVQDVIDTLVAAELIKTEALNEAKEAAAKSQANGQALTETGNGRPLPAASGTE
jgi:uncharacterized membrane protein